MFLSKKKIDVFFPARNAGDEPCTTPPRSSAAFLAEKKKLKFLLPSQRTETSHG